VLQTIGELQRSICAARQRLNKITEHKASLEQRLKTNAEQLSQLEADMRTQANPWPQVTMLTWLTHLAVALFMTPHV